MTSTGSTAALVTDERDARRAGWVQVVIGALLLAVVAWGYSVGMPWAHLTAPLGVAPALLGTGSWNLIRAARLARRRAHRYV
jgi:predicted phage tail protein